MPPRVQTATEAVCPVLPGRGWERRVVHYVPTSPILGRRDYEAPLGAKAGRFVSLAPTVGQALRVWTLFVLQAFRLPRYGDEACTEGQDTPLPLVHHRQPGRFWQHRGRAPGPRAGRHFRSATSHHGGWSVLYRERGVERREVPGGLFLPRLSHEDYEALPSADALHGPSGRSAQLP